jgi:WD40 repeat protein
LVGRPDRLALLAELTDAALDGAACRVVLTVREGYVGRLLSGLDVDGRVRSVPVNPMPRASLAAVIEGPARRADLVLEDGFVQEVLDDVGTGDALPLLALALDRTYRGAVADGVRVLRAERYRSSGGVAAAVARQAAEAANSIGTDGEQRAVNALVQLATVDEEGNWIRRTVSRASFDDSEWQVVEALERFRLVVIGGNDGSATAAVTHSTLFTSWSPLARVLEAKVDDLRFQRRLERDAADWDSDGRPPDQLPLGSRFQQIERFRSRNPDLDLTSTATEYVARARRVAKTRRSRRVLLIAAVVAVVGLVAGLLAIRAQDRARASAAERVAEARRGVARALNEPRFDSAMNIALDALELDPSRDGLEAVLGVVLREPTFRGYAAKVVPAAGRSVAWGFDDELLIGDTGGAVHVVAPDVSDSVTFAASDAVRTVLPGPDGDWMGIGDRAGRVHLWFASESRTLEFHRGDGAPAHSEVVADLVAANPQRLVSAGHDGDVVLWDVAGGEPLWVAHVGGEGDGVWSLAALPQLNAVVVGTRLGVVATVALDEGTVRTIAQLDSGVHSVSASDAQVLAGDGKGRVWLLDIDPGSAVSAAEDVIFQGHQPVRAIAHVDSDRALTGWSDGAVRLIDRGGRLLDEFVAHDEPIRDIAYAPDSESFAATGDDGLVSRWDLSGTSRLVRARVTINGELVGAIDGSNRVFVAGTTGRLSELRPDGTLVDRSEDFGEFVLRLDVNDDGTTAALGFAAHAMAIDIATGRTRADVTPGGDDVRVAIDGNRFIVAGDELVITDLDTGAEQRLEIPADVTTNGLLVDSGTNTIVVGGRMGDRGGVLLVWRDGATAPIRRNIDRVGVSAQGLDIDDDGRWLAVGRNDGRVELWSLDDLELAEIAFTRHDLQITDVTFAPDSATVVSLDADGVVWLWSAEVGTSFAQPIRSGLAYGRRVLVDSEGTEVTVVGRGGVVGIATDATTIQEFGCTLAGIDECPATAGDVRTVLREE